MPYQTIPLNPSGGNWPNIDSTTVIMFKSSNTDLQSLQGQERSACNAIKKWLNSTDCAVWYHNANTDLCSQFGGPHFHVVVRSTERIDGTFEVLQQHANYKTLGKAINGATNPYDSSSSYIRSQRVRSLPNLIRYLCREPRIFLGSRSIALGKLRLETLANAEQNVEPITDLGCDDDDLGDASPELSSKCDLYNDFGPPPKQLKLAPVDRQPIPVECRQTSSNPEKPLKRQNTDSVPSSYSDFTSSSVGEVQGDRTASIIERIMLYVGQYEYESLISAVGRLDSKDETNRKVKILWNKLVIRPGTIAMITRIRDKLKVEYQGMSFTDMCEKFMDSNLASDKSYMSVNDSLDLLDEFCQYNGIDFDELCYTIYQVMNMKVAKQNTFMIMGPSNAGKTVIFKNSLLPIVPFSAQVGSVGNSGQFLWQMCPGNRAIFIEECRMAPEHIETCKLIFGGEDAMVDVKCKPQAKLSRTPVFISTNTYPWLQAPSPADKMALMNRMKIFHCTTWPDLAEYTNPLHPGMWWNICAAIESSGDTTMFDNDKAKDVVFRNPITVDDCKRLSYSGEIVFDNLDFD